MQLPLEDATAAKYLDSATPKPTPGQDDYVRATANGARGFFEAIADTYVELNTALWSLEYWGEEGEPEREKDDDTEPDLVVPLPLEQSKVATVKRTALALKPINDLFKELYVVNPEMPENRRELFRNPISANVVERRRVMTEKMRLLVHRWLLGQLKDFNIEEVFSPDDQNRALLKQVRNLWDELPKRVRIEIEQDGANNASFERLGFYRLMRALLHRLDAKHVDSQQSLTDFEKDLVARLFHVFLYEYGAGASLRSLYGKKNFSAPAHAIRIAYKYIENQNHYEYFYKESDPLVTPANVRAYTANFMGGSSNASRRATLKAWLEDVGGKLPGAPGQDEPTEDEQAQGAQLLYAGGKRRTASEKRAERKKVSDAGADLRRLEQDKNAVLRAARQRQLDAAEKKRRQEVDEVEQAERRRQEAEERRMGLLNQPLILKGWDRSNKSRGLPDASARPWTWEQLKLGGPGIDERLYREALAILGARARREDAKGLKLYQEKQREEPEYTRQRNQDRNNRAAEQARRNATPGIPGSSGPLPEIRRPFSNPWIKYSYSVNARVERLFRQSEFSSAWEWKNHKFKKFQDFKDGIARHLWERVYGHPLPDYKQVFADRSQDYYAGVNEQHERAKDWMRGRVLRPLVPSDDGGTPKQAANRREIELADTLRCQAYETMHSDYQIKNDPRMSHALMFMLESDQARLQLEYERFMSEQHRHLLDVLRACGPNPRTKDLNECYEADRDSYALCPPEEEIEAMETKATTRETAKRQRYWYERHCKPPPEGEGQYIAAWQMAGNDIGDVAITAPNTTPNNEGGETNPRVNTSNVWVDPSGITEEAAKKWVDDFRKAYTDKLASLPEGKDNKTQGVRKSETIKWKWKQWKEMQKLHPYVKDVLNGSPIEFGTMPEPGKPGYYAALKRYIEFTFQLSAPGLLRSGQGGEDKASVRQDEKDMFKNFWRKKEGMPATFKLMGLSKEGMAQEGSSSGSEGGILKALLEEFQAFAEEVDEDYANDEYIGEFFSFWFDKDAPNWRKSEYRAKAKDKKGNKKTPAKVIHTFQSQLLLCFPHRLEDGTVFNDVLDFICWFMTWANVEYHPGDQAPKARLDKVCQFVGLPAWSTWKSPQGPKTDEGQYLDYRINEDVGKAFRKLVLSVYFAKRALDFAMVNKDSVLHDPTSKRKDVADIIKAKWKRFTTKFEGVVPANLPAGFVVYRDDDDDEDGLGDGGNRPGSSTDPPPGPSDPPGGKDDKDDDDDDDDDGPIFGIPAAVVRQKVRLVVHRNNNAWQFPVSAIRRTIYVELAAENPMARSDDRDVNVADSLAFGRLIERELNALFGGIPLSTIHAGLRAALLAADDAQKPYASTPALEEAVIAWLERPEGGNYKVSREAWDARKLVFGDMMFWEDILLKAHKEIEQMLAEVRKWNGLRSAANPTTEEQRAKLLKLEEAVRAAEAELEEWTTVKDARERLDRLKSTLKVARDGDWQYAQNSAEGAPVDLAFNEALNDQRFATLTETYHGLIEQLQTESGKSAAKPRDTYEPPDTPLTLHEQMLEMWNSLEENPTLERVVAALQFQIAIIRELMVNPATSAETVLASRMDVMIEIKGQVKGVKGHRANEVDYAREALRRLDNTTEEWQFREARQSEDGSSDVAADPEAAAPEPGEATDMEVEEAEQAEQAEQVDERSIAERRKRRSGEDAKAGESELREKIEILKAGNKLVSLGIWAGPDGFNKKYAETYTSAPYNGTHDQWKRIFTAISSNRHLAILRILGSTMPSSRHSAILELLAEFLPQMGIIALNIGEFTNASREAFEKFERALAHEDCIVAHLYYSTNLLPPDSTETKERLQDQLTRNRYKLAYCQQLVRAEVWRLHGMNCWMNFLTRHWDRANDRVREEEEAIPNDLDRERKRQNDKIEGDMAVARDHRRREQKKGKKAARPEKRGSRKK